MTAGSIKVTVDTQGNVGIGTTNAPAAADTNNTAVVNVGVVTANNLYGEGGDLTLGNINGGYRAGAYTVEITDTIDNSIDELNYILGKLVPTPLMTLVE